MKILKFFLMVICSIVFKNIAIADTDEFPQFLPLYGTTPDTAVTHWIKYLVLGPQNAPFPIVWISSQSFKLSGFPEFLVVLSPKKYEVVAKFTTARIDRKDCRRVWPKPADWHTVEISENISGEIRRCVLPQGSACSYLSEVLNLPIDWSISQREPIDILIRSLQCKF